MVNFQLPDETMETERALAKKLGVGFLNLPMPGDGFGQEAQFRQVLEAIDDPARRPVLVHCAGGRVGPDRPSPSTGTNATVGR